MIAYEIKKELNHTYIVMKVDDNKTFDDYRFKMLKENRIKSLIPMDVRNINGEYLLYYDITDKESLDDYLKVHIVTEEIIKGVLSGLMLLSENLRIHFCEEELIISVPGLVFKNRIDDSYEFICVPFLPEDDGDESCQVLLLQAFMEKIDVGEPELIESLFEIYDMAESGVKSYKTLYEKLTYSKTESALPGEPQNILPVDETSQTSEDINEIKACAKSKWFDNLYKPSIRETLSVLCTAAGIILLLAYTYFTWISETL